MYPLWVELSPNGLHGGIKKDNNMRRVAKKDRGRGIYKKRGWNFLKRKTIRNY